MDGYRRGRNVDRHRRARNPKVNAPYRPLVLIVWVLGVVLLLATSPLGPKAGLGVLVVTHVCFAGFVRADIATLRRQGLDWGLSRHVWFAGALIVPLVAPTYYLYCGRRVAAENRARGFGDRDEGGETGVGVGADAAAADADTGADAGTVVGDETGVDTE